MNLSSLNDQQKKAVTAPLGPVLVLAGAGSGKTRVLAYRIGYLIEQGLVPAQHILALTFTNKAAKEMQGRVYDLLNQGVMPDSDPASRTKELDSGSFSGSSKEAGMTSRKNIVSTVLPTMGTFHSVGARLLRKEIDVLGYSKSFIIFDSDDTLKVIKEICLELETSSRFPPSFFRNIVSNAKNLLQTPDTFNVGLEEPLASQARSVYARYQNYMFQQNAVDFDDLIMLPIKIFEASKQVLEKYQNLFQYILVDEYQDTNPAQYRLLQLLVNQLSLRGAQSKTQMRRSNLDFEDEIASLSRPSDTQTGQLAMTESVGNLFVVGDDAQSIYGFRGSDIRNILHFEKDFPKATVIALEQNYRSTQHILSAASKVIALNPEQKKKELWTNNEPGQKVVVTETRDEIAEAEFVATHIIKLATSTSSRGGNASDRRGDLYLNDEIASSDALLAMTETYEQLEEEPEEKPFSILDQFLKKAKRQSIGPVVGKLPLVHTELSEFAVLYRTHAQSRALEEVFIAAGIPYQIVGGVKFYERKEIKDMLAYVRLVLNYRDLVSLKRVINVPTRGIGEKSYEVLKEFLQRHEITNGHTNDTNTSAHVDLQSLKLTPKSKQAVQHFFDLITAAGNFEFDETLVSLMRWLIKKTGMEKFLRDGTDVGEGRWENVEELVSVASQYNHLPWQEAGHSFLEEVALFTDIDTVEDKKDVVTLMTLHSAKGLEFDTVFFVGLEEGVLPHSRSLLNPSELSEEIRLAYVGLTRARKRLFLTYARSRTVFGNTQIGTPSRILQALPEAVVEFKGRKLYTRTEPGELNYEPFE